MQMCFISKLMIYLFLQIILLSIYIRCQFNLYDVDRIDDLEYDCLYYYKEDTPSRFTFIPIANYYIDQTIEYCRRPHNETNILTDDFNVTQQLSLSFY